MINKINNKITAKGRQEIRSLRAAGWTIADIADAYGVSRTSIYYHVHDVPAPEGEWRRGPTATIDTKLAARMRKQGMTLGQIAESFGASVAGVQTCLRRAAERAVA